MKNKIIAIFGVVLLMVLNSLFQMDNIYNILFISGLLTAFNIFTIMIFWKYFQGLSILLVFSSVVYIGSTILETEYIIINIARIFYSILIFISITIIWDFEKIKLKINKPLFPDETDDDNPNKYDYLFLDRQREGDLGNYFLGIVKAYIVIFILGKVIGYYDGISWWHIITPIIVCFIGVLINTFYWKDDRTNGFVFNFFHTLYSIIRYFILRVILWLPFLIAYFNGMCIVKKYGNHGNVLIIVYISCVAVYYFIIKLSGKTPEISDYSIPN